MTDTLQNNQQELRMGEFDPTVFAYPPSPESAGEYSPENVVDFIPQPPQPQPEQVVAAAHVPEALDNRTALQAIRFSGDAVVQVRAALLHAYEARQNARSN